MITRQVAGEIAELHVFGELLKRGAVAYVPLVQDGPDALIRTSSGPTLELQITSAGGTGGRHPRWFQVATVEPRNNLFIVCVEFADGEPGDAWVFPSAVFDEYAGRPARGTPRDLDLDTGVRKHGMPLRDLLSGFRNRWELIAHFERYEHLLESPEDLEDVLTMGEALESSEEESMDLEEYERRRPAAI